MKELKFTEADGMELGQLRGWLNELDDSFPSDAKLKAETSWGGKLRSVSIRVLDAPPKTDDAAAS